MKGILEIDNVNDELNIVVIGVLVFLLNERIVLMICILLWNFLVNIGWIGLLIRCVVKVVFVFGCFLCLLKLFGNFLVVYIFFL